jgi:DNA-binding transcriptional regulator YdaS (Cro superfamily)
MEGIHPLKAFRQNRKPPMSRAELASFLGVMRTTVHRWETGERNIDRELVPAISKKTGIAARDLRPDLAELIGATR